MTALTAKRRLTVTPGAPIGGGGSATFDGSGRWTPAKDGSGLVTDSEWNGLPLNTWIDWAVTSLQSQLSSPWGAAVGYVDPGNSGVLDHYAGFTGAGLDAVNERLYHFGGGHDGSANNMLTEFDAAKGTHRVVIPPTHQSFFPPGYSAIHAAGYTWVRYPSEAVPTRVYQYFPSGETTPGDDKACASHMYSGIVFVPGINEVVMPRNGWFHAKLSDSSWRVGPQDVTGTGNSIGYQAHYIASLGRICMTESLVAPGAVMEYDPVNRVVTTIYGVASAQWGYLSSACVDENEHMWYFLDNGDNGSFKVHQINFPGRVTVQAAATVTGRMPQYAIIGDTNGNPCDYVPDLGKILMWCTTSRSGGAQAGEMLSFDRATRVMSLHAVSGTPPPVALEMNNKMRYLTAKKVMLFNTAVDQNVRLIKLA